MTVTESATVQWPCIATCRGSGVGAPALEPVSIVDERRVSRRHQLWIPHHFKRGWWVTVLTSWQGECFPASLYDPLG